MLSSWAYFLEQIRTGRQDGRSLAAPGLKIVLPKSLDGDSAGGVVFPTPPVPNIAEALFNATLEPPTPWPAATCSSLRVHDVASVSDCFTARRITSTYDTITNIRKCVDVGQPLSTLEHIWMCEFEHQRA